MCDTSSDYFVPKITPTPSADGHGCRMRETGENMDGSVGFHSIGEKEGARDQSYPFMIGIEGATEI